MDGGGRDCRKNIVAACRYCNEHRHHTPKPKTPEAYKTKVMSRIKAGRWLRLPDPPVLCLDKVAGQVTIVSFED
ncbi:hypothetical protein [Asticcacaulis sp. AC460]|uniref:hypothetical protein n=1 Tax=Asticcacaulis sp. AC460 TaxID=1282360 RepID=UPI00350E9458